MSDAKDPRAKWAVLTDAEWNRLHADHGPKTREPYPHPDGTWVWAVCPCGAKHLRTKVH